MGGKRRLRGEIAALRSSEEFGISSLAMTGIFLVPPPRSSLPAGPDFSQTEVKTLLISVKYSFFRGVKHTNI